MQTSYLENPKKTRKLGILFAQLLQQGLVCLVGGIEGSSSQVMRLEVGQTTISFRRKEKETMQFLSQSCPIFQVQLFFVSQCHV